MVKFFEAIGLIQKFTVKFGATQSDILSGLRFIMEDRSSDVYGQKTRKFVGRIKANGFKLSRRPNLFDINGEGFVSAVGRLKQQGHHVVVETEVGVNIAFKICLGLWVFIFLAIAVFIISHDPSGNTILMTFAFLGGALLLSLVVQWFFARITIESFKRELERNFHKILG